MILASSSQPVRPQAILFDWDNTLVDSWQIIHDALNQTFAIMNYPQWSFEETKLRSRHSLRDSFPKLFGDSWEQAKSIYLDAFQSIHLERLRPIDGAESLLQQLRDDGIYLGVVSNKTGRFVRREVEALGWDKYFGSVIGAGDAEADKPSRAPVDLALSGTGIAAGETVWFVGDTGIDMQTAVNAGCVPVLFSLPGADPEPAEVLSAAVHLVDSWTAFNAVLAGIAGKVAEVG